MGRPHSGRMTLARPFKAGNKDYKKEIPSRQRRMKPAFVVREGDESSNLPDSCEEFDKAIVPPEMTQRL